MKTAVTWTTRGLSLLALLALGASLASTPATAAPGTTAPKTPGAPTPAPTLRAPAQVRPNTPTLRIDPAKTCGLGQVQCFVAGGKVPPSVAEGSPDSFRLKVCVGTSDPRFGCGACERCPLVNTVDPYCSKSGCDYRTCAPDFVDADGNRKNGCEQYRPSPPPKQAAAVPAGAACTTDALCGTDARCRPSGAARTCQDFRCAADADCAYLNLPDATRGAGRCQPTGPGADRHGCVFQFPVCAPFQTVDRGRCIMPRYDFMDADGDRQDAVAYGGADCDDSDPNRFSGNNERCDAYHHDEDCDPYTHGGEDADGDGLASASCCNVLPDGRKACGPDCDDATAAVARGGMRCGPDGQAQVCVVERLGTIESGSWVSRPCAPGTRCVPQPNGTGVCH